MRKITAIAWKDAIIEFSSPANIMTFIFLPIIFTFFLGGGLSGGGNKAIDVLVVDEDGSATAAALLDELEASETIRVRKMERQGTIIHWIDGDLPMDRKVDMALKWYNG